MLKVCKKEDCQREAISKGKCRKCYTREWIRENRRRRREQAVEEFGSKCGICGSTKKLEFDHIDPNSKAIKSCYMFTSKKKTEIELTKCQLLCHECHKQKTKSEWGKGIYKSSGGRAPQPLIHGKYSNYSNKKCRCKICTSSWNTTLRERRLYKAALEAQNY